MAKKGAPAQNLRSSDELAVNAILGDLLGVDDAQLRPEANLWHDLGFDSLDMVELSMELESKLVIVVPEERMEQVQTVGDIYKLVGQELRQVKGGVR